MGMHQRPEIIFHLAHGIGCNNYNITHYVTLISEGSVHEDESYEEEP